MNSLFIKKYLLLLALFLMPIFSANNGAIVVGTKIAPPFVMYNKLGELEGISIELWKHIAQDLKLDYTFKVEQNITSLLSDVAQKRTDVAIAAITITAPREELFDFTHCYYTTGLAIAINKSKQSNLVTLFKAFFSFKMLTIMASLATLLLFIGTITWLVERKRNKENFHTDPIKGIASGVWWAAVTMTTVGYGDMTPKTLSGRLIALFWMFASLLLVSSIIATVASVLTVANINHAIEKPQDLTKGTIASVKGSVSDTYLKDRRVYPVYYKTVSDALKALSEKRVDAVVYDAPLLKYLIKKDYPNSLMVTNSLFKTQNYAIALEGNSTLKEPINRVLLKLINRPLWEEIKHKYLE